MAFRLAEKVTEVPELYEKGTRSTACLLKDAGFPDQRQPLSVDEVEQVLERRPRLLDLWLKRARDQRLAGGWGIECQDSAYRVQSYATGNALVTHDRRRACAEFVVRYVSFIGDVLNRGR